MSTQDIPSPGKAGDVLARGAYLRFRLQQRIGAWTAQLRDPEQQNALHLYGDIAWFGIANGILGTFTGVFAIRLGASDTLVGLLSSLPALINIFWQVPSARIVERGKSVLATTVKSLFLQRLIYLLIALMPFVLLTYRAEAVVALITLSALPGALGGVAFTTLLARSVSATRRASLVSVRNMLLALTSMLSVLAAGRLLDAILFPYNYQIIFGLAFAASMLSLRQVHKVEIETQAQAPGTNPMEEHEKKPLRERIRQTWRGVASEKPFLRFAAASFVYNWGLYFPMALYSLYRVNALGATDTWLGALSTTMSAVQVVMFVVWGRVMRRSGSRRLLLLSAFGLAGFPLFTGMATSVEPLLFVAIWGAFFSSAYRIANFDTLLSVSPADRLPTYTAIYNTLANLAAFVGPLLGIMVAGWIGLRYALVLAGGLRLIGALVMSRLDFGPPGPPGTGPGFIERLCAYLAHQRLWHSSRKLAESNPPSDPAQ